MYRDLKIIVIAPCYNEASKIASVVQRVRETGVVDEIVVVDDGSTDRSAEQASYHGATVIKMEKTIGVGAAIRKGLLYAKDRCDIIVVIAGNNKDNPQEICRLVDPIAEKRADFVQGSRFLRGGYYGGDMPVYRKFATRLHPLLFSLVTGTRVSESTNGFRAFRPKILEDPRIQLHQKWLDGYELEPYLYYKVVTLKYKVAEVPVTKIYPPKKLGNTKMIPVISWWEILRPLLLLRLGLRK